jgi:hypothetical integral membrane protein (TIGR02206 family)
VIPEIPPPFVAYGIAHAGALVLTAAASAALAALVRTRPRTAPFVRTALFVAIALVLAFELSIGAREGWLTWRTLIPLHLCDAAMVLALVTLVWPRRASAEILYFWAGAGSSLAMLTPDLPWGFPRWEFVVFFGLHGLVLVAALVLVFGLGLRPRPRAAWRAFVATLALAAAAGVVNVLLGTNFMFLRGKPLGSTPLDWMGPWPVYIAVASAVALALYHLLALPFRHDGRGTEGGG